MTKRSRVRAISKARRPIYAFRAWTPLELCILEFKVAVGKYPESILEMQT